jgi:flavin-binding protein dodecin
VPPFDRLPASLYPRGPFEAAAAGEEDGCQHPPIQGGIVAESVYKVIELVGTSTESWERAAAAAIERASGSIRDLRVAEVSELDMHLEDGRVAQYRAKVKVSFKYEEG